MRLITFPGVEPAPTPIAEQLNDWSSIRLVRDTEAKSALRSRTIEVIRGSVAAARAVKKVRAVMNIIAIT